MEGDLLVIAAAVAGAVVCRRGVRRGSGVHRYGFWFFVMVVLASVLSFLCSAFVTPFVLSRWADASLRGIGWLMAAIYLPGRAIALAAYAILVFGFYRCSKQGG